MKELDFSRLAAIAPKKPQAEPNEHLGDKPIPESKKPAEAILEADTGISWLQSEADKRRSEIERAQRIIQEHQRNVKDTNRIQTEILKGVKAGESVYTLFLKAIKSISLMTADNLFYSQVEADIAAIYGAGLLEPKPLEMEIEAIEERLARLRAAHGRDEEPEDSRKRIDAAIKAHEARAETLKNCLAQ